MGVRLFTPIFFLGIRNTAQANTFRRSSAASTLPHVLENAKANCSKVHCVTNSSEPRLPVLEPNLSKQKGTSLEHSF